MKTFFCIAIFLLPLFGPVRAQDLGKDHKKLEQTFYQETRVLKYAPDGTRQDSDVYRLWIKETPDGEGEKYTCLRFTVQSGNKPAYSIPSLVDFSYHYSASPLGKDRKGQLFGIDHSAFEKLKDSSGKSVPLEQTYLTYNAFVDFHSLFVFSEKSDSGRGVQDLHQPGDKIIHGASFSEPEENLGSQVAAGSKFKNGLITLEWKGNGPANGRNCAILGYDSGESSFYVITKPFPMMTVKTKGSSHYFGDVFKDLETGWIQKASMHEIVVSETAVPAQKDIHSVIERKIILMNMGY